MRDLAAQRLVLFVEKLASRARVHEQPMRTVGEVSRADGGKQWLGTQRGVSGRSVVERRDQPRIRRQQEMLGRDSVGGTVRRQGVQPFDRQRLVMLNLQRRGRIGIATVACDGGEVQQRQQRAVERFTEIRLIACVWLPV